MAVQWHYQHGGQQRGPVTGAELKVLAAAGTLLPTALVWRDGMEKWVPALSLKGLFPAVATPPARPAPTPPTPAEAVRPGPPPLPDEEDGGPPPATTRVGKAGSSALLWAKRLFDKGKGVWRRSSPPLKIGIVVCAGAIGILFALVPALLLSGGMSSGGVSSSPLGPSPTKNVFSGGEPSSAGGNRSSGGVGGTSAPEKYTRIELINFFSETNYKDMEDFYRSVDTVFLFDGNNLVAMYDKDRGHFSLYGVKVDVKASHKQYSRTRGGDISPKTWTDKFGSLPEVKSCYEPLTKTFYTGKTEQNGHTSLQGNTRILCKDGSMTFFITNIGRNSFGDDSIRLNPVFGLF